MDAAAALNAAQQLVGTPQSKPKRTIKDVEPHHCDYGYIGDCSDAHELECIVKVLLSGKYGRYPDLENFAEKKLFEMKPNSDALKKTEKMRTVQSLDKDLRDSILDDMAGWATNAGEQDQYMKEEAKTRKQKKGASSALPPVRGKTNVRTTAGNNSAKPKTKPSKKKGKKAKQAIPGGDFRAWDKFDVDAALDDMDEDNKPISKVEEVSSDEEDGNDRQFINNTDSSGRKLPATKISKKPKNPIALQKMAMNEKEKGNECFRAGDYEEAVIYYSRSLDAIDTTAVYNNRALAHLKRKAYIKAMEDCGVVLEREPTNVKALLRQANSLKGANRNAEALASANRVLELKPENPEARKLKAELSKSAPTKAAPAKRMVIEEDSDSDSEDDEGAEVVHAEAAPAKAFTTDANFLADNKGKAGVTTLPSGLQYKVLRAGAGDAHPLASTPCACHYEGRCAKDWPAGAKFDSSYDRGAPTTFAPNQVIKGWTEAMQLMVEGDKWEMYLPANLAYGDSGRVAGCLVFTMEIVQIKGGTKPRAKKASKAKKAAEPKAPTPEPKAKRIMIEEDSEDSEDEDEGEDEEGGAGADSSAQATTSFSDPSAKTTADAAPTPAPAVAVAKAEAEAETKAAPPAAVPEDDATPAEVLKIKDEGKGFFVAGDYGNAADRYSASLIALRDSKARCSKTQVALLSNRAMCHLKIGNCSKCINDCDAVLNLDGGHAKAMLTRASANETKESFRKAFLDYKAVLTAYPSNSTASLGLGRVTKMLEDLEGKKWIREQQGKSTVVLTKPGTPSSSPVPARKAAEPKPKAAPAKVAKEAPPAEVEEAKEDEGSAKAQLAQAYEDLKAKGNKCVQRKEYGQAVNCYTQCVALDATKAAAYNNRTLCYLKQSQWNNAIGDSDAVLRIEPGNSKAMYRKAQALVGLGHTEDARDMYVQCVAADPKNKKAVDELAALPEPPKASLITEIEEPAKAPPKVEELASGEKSMDDIVAMRDRLLRERAEAEKQVADTAAKLKASAKGVDAMATELEVKEAELAKASAQIDDKLINLTENLSAHIVDAVDNAKKPDEPPAPAPAKPKAAATPKKAAATPKKNRPAASTPSKSPKKATPVEFMRQLGTLGSNADKLSAYLSTVAPRRMKALFRNRLEADHITSMLQAVAVMEPAPAFAFLKHMTEVDRFDMIYMFLSDSDRKIADTALARVSASGAVDAEELESVVTKYTE